MNPRIVGIAGPALRTPVPVTGDSITIGRRSTNDAVVNDLTASRAHCRITRNGDDFSIEDLESQNGTYVNQKLVERVELKHGDEISIGNAVFVFLTEPDEPASKLVEVELDEPQDLSRNTKSMPIGPGDILSRQADRVDSRNLRDLRTLLEICSTLRPEAGLESLQERLLELLLSTIPAKRGAIFLRARTRRSSARFLGWTENRHPRRFG